MKFTHVSSLLLAVASASPVEHTDASLKAQALENARMAADAVETAENNLVGDTVNLVDNMVGEESSSSNEKRDQNSDTTLGDMLGDVMANNPDVLSRLLAGVLGGSQRQHYYEKRDGAANDQLGAVLGDLLDNEIASAFFDAALSGNGAQQMEKREESDSSKNGDNGLVGGLLQVLLGTDYASARGNDVGGGSNGLRGVSKTVGGLGKKVGGVGSGKLPGGVSAPKVPTAAPADQTTTSDDQTPEDPAAEQAESADNEEAEEAIPEMEKRDSALGLDLNSILAETLGDNLSSEQRARVNLGPLVDSLLAQDGAVNRLTEGTYGTLNAGHEGDGELERRDGALGGLLNLNLGSLLGSSRANREAYQAAQAMQAAQAGQGAQGNQQDSNKQFEEAVLVNALRSLQQATQNKQQGQGGQMVEGPAPRQ
ncbi:hypothetical protein XA68_18026 [Ophiocordyceps unilateralis]|uniref:Uncharacterized protein n=1 Tax=Ophiocordyceps unilateralis TaxID=268505 RepID=A0A2A9P2A5_OPHUN|nr:hypothetical protein XA68_18026 [Ophiocordyceps unilateralis]